MKNYCNEIYSEERNIDRCSLFSRAKMLYKTLADDVLKMFVRFTFHISYFKYWSFNRRTFVCKRASKYAPLYGEIPSVLNHSTVEFRYFSERPPGS